jgi:hypothetical protein
MPFINEHITVGDLARYEIEKIDKQFLIGGTSSRTWTVDRERDIYLRKVASGREDDLGRLTWTFYWRGELIRVDTTIVNSSGHRGGAITTHMKVTRLGIPGRLANEQLAILTDLRDALTAHGDDGVHSTASSYILTLEY